MYLTGVGPGNTIIKLSVADPNLRNPYTAAQDYQAWMINSSDARFCTSSELAATGRVSDLTVDCAPSAGPAPAAIGGINLICSNWVAVSNVSVRNIRHTTDAELFGINLSTPLNGYANRAVVSNCEVRDAYLTNNSYATEIILGTQYDGYDRFNLNVPGSDDWMNGSYFAGVAVSNYVHDLPASHAYGAAYVSEILFTGNLSDNTGDAFNCDTSRTTSGGENVGLRLWNNTFNHCRQGIKIGSSGSGLGNTNPLRLGADIYGNIITNMVSYTNNNIAFMMNGGTHNVFIENNDVYIAPDNSSTIMCGVSQCWFAPIPGVPDVCYDYAWTVNYAGYHGSGKEYPYVHRVDHNDTTEVSNNTFILPTNVAFTNNLFKRQSDATTTATGNTPAVLYYNVADDD